MFWFRWIPTMHLKCTRGLRLVESHHGAGLFCVTCLSHLCLSRPLIVDRKQEQWYVIINNYTLMKHMFSLITLILIPNIQYEIWCWCVPIVQCSTFILCTYHTIACCLKELCSETDESASSQADARSSVASIADICWFWTSLKDSMAISDNKLVINVMGFVGLKKRWVLQCSLKDDGMLYGMMLVLLIFCEIC